MRKWRRSTPWTGTRSTTGIRFILPEAALIAVESVVLVQYFKKKEK